MPIGRPRAFDVDKALDRALKVFWRKGYEGASLPDLTRAMGINRPSLYAAFGNKEALFRKAIDRYAAGPASHVKEALNQPTALAVTKRLLGGSIDLITDSRNPRGCFMVQGALACGDDADRIRRELVKRRAAFEAALAERFERALAEGDLPADAGMAVQAAGGATRGELMRVADLALRAWPA
jgi:AcrR family transcriptional regulator